VVSLIILIGALTRHFFNRIDAGDDFNYYGWAAFAAVFILMCAIYVTAPRAPTAIAGSVSDAAVLAIAQKHCVSCHAKKPTHESFSEAPKGVLLETVTELKQYAPLVLSQAVVNKAMPLGNQSGMTEAEREKIGQWIAALK
jgi:uncharacterized membrane protein